jgi:tryptophan halogenase
MIKVCVVGAGFTGWLTAIVVKKNCPNVAVTLLDSPTESKNIGFGESCPPVFLRWMFEKLKIKEQDRQEWFKTWVKETKSTMKASAKWQNWTAPNDDPYYAPFVLNTDSRALLDLPPEPDKEVYKLTDLWYELASEGKVSPGDFDKDLGNLYWTLAKNQVPYADGEFLWNNAMSIQISSYDVMQWFAKEYSDELDNILKITVKDVILTEKGNVGSIIDHTGATHKFDIYIDCTGFKRVMSKYVDFGWGAPTSKILHTSSVIMSNGYTDEADINKNLTSYTSFKAMPYGWSWEIPLMHRKSYGYVFDKNFTTDQQAIDELLKTTGTDKIVQDPFVVHWVTGWNRNSWRGNVITAGMASGFIDALDANSIAIHTQQVDRIVMALNNFMYMPEQRDKYNYMTNELFNDLIDRQDAQFALAPRNDTEYWKRNKTLHNKQDLLDLAFGKLRRRVDLDKQFALFSDLVWCAYFNYYGHDMSPRCRVSSPELKQAGQEFFKQKAQQVQAQSQRTLLPADWLREMKVDVDALFMQKGQRFC